MSSSIDKVRKQKEEEPSKKNKNNNQRPERKKKASGQSTGCPGNGHDCHDSPALGEQATDNFQPDFNRNINVNSEIILRFCSSEAQKLKVVSASSPTKDMSTREPVRSGFNCRCQLGCLRQSVFVSLSLLFKATLL